MGNREVTISLTGSVIHQKAIHAVQAKTARPSSDNPSSGQLSTKKNSKGPMNKLALLK